MNVQDRIKIMHKQGTGVFAIADELKVFPSCVIDVLQGKDVFRDKATMHTWDISDYMETVHAGDDVIVYVRNLDPVCNAKSEKFFKEIATVKQKYPHIVATTKGEFQHKELYQWNCCKGDFDHEVSRNWV